MRKASWQPLPGAGGAAHGRPFRHHHPRRELRHSENECLDAGAPDVDPAALVTVARLIQEPLAQVEVLAARRRVLGDADLSTLQSVQAVGEQKRKVGAYRAAIALFDEAVAGRKVLLGNRHPATLASLHAAAEARSASNTDFRGQERDAAAALTGRRKTLGSLHPDTLKSVQLAGQSGVGGNQISLFKEALAGRQRVLGRDHPDTLYSMLILAIMLQRKKDYAAAQPLYEEALTSQRRTLGDENPATLASINNLAGLLEDIGDHTAARSLYEEALAGRRRTLGDKCHTATLISINNLAMLLKDKKDYAAAQLLLEKALAGRLPECAGFDQQPGGVANGQGRIITAARALFEESLAAARRVYDIIIIISGPGEGPGEAGEITCIDDRMTL